MRRLALLCSAVLFLAPTLVHAQNHRDLVLRQLEAVREQVRKSGYHVATNTLGEGTVVGQLSANGRFAVEVDLVSGRGYMIAAGCDRDCTDLDLRLYSGPDNDVVAEDIEDDDVPVLEFVANRSGRHLLMVSLPSCSTEMCWFGFRVFEK